MEKKDPSKDKEKKVDDLARRAGEQPPSNDPSANLREHYRGPQIPNIGRADLDPLAGGIGGGMIFDPNDPSHFMRPNDPPYPGLSGYVPSPSGMIPRPPPGARFDPFGPGYVPGRGLRGPFPRAPRGPGQGPDNDHMRPHGWDDAFM